MSAKKQGYSPSSVQDLNFFQHFPRQRVCPYSQVKETTADSTMLEKASLLNHENLLRRAVPLSEEVAGAIMANIPLLKEMLWAIDENMIIRQVDGMTDIVKSLITKSELSVCTSDIHLLLKYAITDNDRESDETLNQIEFLGTLLCDMGSQ